ncbi:MAG: N-acetylglucosamine-6-phosphate deacetylase [Phycisphaerae bacterium]|nr:N-acetylglucosamine-6-phosphate deacetylase [Phycisphaerae bacterium]
MQILIKNATVVLPETETLTPNCAVAVEGGEIVNVCKADELQDAAAEQVVDANGKYLAPGFIDLHIHGSDKFLVDNGPTDLARLCKLLPRYGVTGFLPTVCPLPADKDAKLLASLAEVQSGGAEILGFHLEGPFLALTGALPPEAIGQADPARVRSLIAAAKPYRTIFSVAPDFEAILDLIPIMAKGGSPVFMTHTAASVKQTQAAIEAGIRHATHFYDVFPVPPEHEAGVRPCGAIETILADPRVSVDFILDGEHVDPIAVKMALQCKGPSGVCLITDANIGAGLPPGRYAFGEAEIEFKYEGGPARLTEKSDQPGGLAGSGLTMDRAVRNAVKMLDVDLPQAIRMAAANPARVLGLENRKGQIKTGFDADMILLDESLEVTQTWIGGKCMFGGENAARKKRKIK